MSARPDSAPAAYRAFAFALLTASLAIVVGLAVQGVLERSSRDGLAQRALVYARTVSQLPDAQRAKAATHIRDEDALVQRVVVVDAGGVDELGISRGQGITLDTEGRTGPFTDEDSGLGVRSNALSAALEDQSGKLTLAEVANPTPDGGVDVALPLLDGEGAFIGAVVVVMARAPGSDLAVPIALATALLAALLYLIAARVRPQPELLAALIAACVLAVTAVALLKVGASSLGDGAAIQAQALTDARAALGDAYTAAEPLSSPALHDALTAAAATPAPALLPLFLGMFIALLVIALVTGPLSRLLHGIRQQPGIYGYVGPAMVSTVVLVFVPFLMGVGLAFFSAGKGGPETWKFIGLDNFAEILGSGDTADTQFYHTLWMTFLWTVLNVFLHVSIGLGLALLLNRPNLRFRAVYRVLLIVPWAVPSYITALIWKWMFNTQYGVINQILAVVGIDRVDWLGQSVLTNFTANLVTNTWLGFPFMMVVSLGALQSIPKELYEAASIDGATRWQQFKTITLPLLKPALFPAIILGVIWTFNMFNVIYLVSGGGPDNKTNILITEAYYAFKVLGRYGFAAAYSLLIFVILFAYATITNRVTRATEGAFE